MAPRDGLTPRSLGLIIIISFIIPGQAVIQQTVPQHFPWYLFMIGLGSGLGAFGWKWRKK